MRKDQKSLGMGKTGKWKKVLVHTKIYYNTHLPLTTSYLEAIIRKMGDITLKIKTLERWVRNMGEGDKGVLQGHLSFLGSAHYRLMMLHRNASTDFKNAPNESNWSKSLHPEKGYSLEFQCTSTLSTMEVGFTGKILSFLEGAGGKVLFQLSLYNKYKLKSWGLYIRYCMIIRITKTLR